MQPEPVVAWVRAASELMGLEAARADEAAVVVQFERLAGIAAKLEALELGVEVEPLVRFVR